jgi:hypothetical protein
MVMDLFCGQELRPQSGSGLSLDLFIMSATLIHKRMKDNSFQKEDFLFSEVNNIEQLPSHDGTNTSPFLIRTSSIKYSVSIGTIKT